MKHLNYCFKDGRNNSGRERRPYQIEKFTIYSFTLDDIPKKSFTVEFTFGSYFFFLRRYFITFLCFFRGKEEFREEREWTEKLWFTLLQIRLIFPAICHERKKNNKFWGFGARAGEKYRINMIEIWNDFFSPSPCFVLQSHLWVIVHLQAVNKNVLQHQAPFFEKMVVLWCRP